jgi:hypothetical protein
MTPAAPMQSATTLTTKTSILPSSMASTPHNNDNDRQWPRCNWQQQRQQQWQPSSDSSLSSA